ncbi:MAG: hypothetical protein K2H40_15300, partial [Lachnospiraceae bacterium]|nr:hypothetical protein [Lachnospiraceae bacterium]
ENVHLLAKEEFSSGYFKISESNEEIKILKSYFEAAGKELIMQKAYDQQGKMKENWSEERIQNSFLGYNDAQQLIVFAWNTPTYTLTALWMQGKVSGKEWYPLFPRIDK